MQFEIYTLQTSHKRITVRIPMGRGIHLYTPRGKTWFMLPYQNTIPSISHLWGNGRSENSECSEFGASHLHYSTIMVQLNVIVAPFPTVVTKRKCKWKRRRNAPVNAEWDSGCKYCSWSGSSSTLLHSLPSASLPSFKCKYSNNPFPD